jgi:hypothetical protein
MLSPPFRQQDPGPIRHRWLVAYMLAMATLEVGHPITVFVQMKSDNGLLHARTSVSTSSSIPTQTAENRLCAIKLNAPASREIERKPGTMLKKFVQQFGGRLRSRLRLSKVSSLYS